MGKRPQRGFVLVATLWILAIVTIAAAYFAERVSRSLEMARKKQETAEQLLEFSDTRADILFRMGTVPFSFHGLGASPAIALDDRPYRGTGSDIVRLQDNLGLINVNFVQADLLSRFLALQGVPFEFRDAMIDTLRDYTDADSLRRLNGAEASEYSARGLPPPPNDLLHVPDQLRNIIGWRDRESLWEKPEFARALSTARVAGFNPNTAPREVLAALPGMSLEAATNLVKLREEKPFYGSNELTGYAAGSIDIEFFAFFPTNSVRVTQQSRRVPWALQLSLTLTPRSETAPWRVDYEMRTPVSYAVENEDKIPKLPAASETP